MRRPAYILATNRNWKVLVDIPPCTRATSRNWQALGDNHRSTRPTSRNYWRRPARLPNIRSILKMHRRKSMDGLRRRRSTGGRWIKPISWALTLLGWMKGLCLRCMLHIQIDSTLFYTFCGYSYMHRSGHGRGVGCVRILMRTIRYFCCSWLTLGGHLLMIFIVYKLKLLCYMTYHLCRYWKLKAVDLKSYWFIFLKFLKGEGWWGVRGITWARKWYKGGALLCFAYLRCSFQSWLTFYNPQPIP